MPQFRECFKEILIKDKKFYLVDFNNNPKFILINVDFKDGFLYDKKSSKCYLSSNGSVFDNSVGKLNEFGIYDYQFNFLMGLTAILICFSFLIGLIIVGATR
ncbi:hypothetical protein CRN67_03020 [Campylobacter blaseri]|uniref:Uncharacterized protein n=1 Tax=Campylobacter blaseri TaxID=2042961 RepID=A0A2P8R2I2_9BACT|nr:hypothetical protein CQ405_03020 [Campylobacter blaseri]PSM54364.1 hypothetical protein CRN67_03020 [Campylobacter blaseri]